MTRVLVVEDDPDTRAMMAEALRQSGFDTIAALDGNHALRIGTVHRPDVIVLDFDLPECDGPTFAAKWRRRMGRAATPIIGVSALRDARDIAARIGVDAFLPKPLRIDELTEKVSAHARNGPSESGAPPP